VIARRLLSMLAMVLLLAGCAKKAEPPEESENATQAADSTEREAYVESARARLAAFDARLDSLKSQVTTADRKARVILNAEIDQLGVERRKADIQLQQLQTSSAMTWEKFRQDLATALDTLDAKFDRARAHMHP